MALVVKVKLAPVDVIPSKVGDELAVAICHGTLLSGYLTKRDDRLRTVGLNEVFKVLRGRPGCCDRGSIECRSGLKRQLRRGRVGRLTPEERD